MQLRFTLYNRAIVRYAPVMEPISNLDLLIALALALWPLWLILAAVGVALLATHSGYMAPDEYEEPPAHVCHLPWGGEPGQVWVCRCGQQWSRPGKAPSAWMTPEERNYHGDDSVGR